MTPLKRTLFFFIFIIAATTVHACDICGCGVGNTYIGLLPDFRKHIVGFRLRHNSLFTHVGVDGATTYLTTREQYQTLEAWTGWNITPRVRVMAVIPYNVNQKENQGNVYQKSGVGDVLLVGYYQALNRRHAIFKNKTMAHTLWLGGGVKLATGKYSPVERTTSGNDANLFQLGTGSYDFMLSAMYDIRLQDGGLNLSSNYRITNSNTHHYQYGNKISATVLAYHKFSVRKNSIAPNMGIQAERAQQDTDNGYSVFVSGGRLMLATFGIESVIGKLAVGGNFQLPLSQDLASGIVKANNRVMLHVAFTW